MSCAHVILALGSNQGDRLFHLESALREISALSINRELKISSVYENPAVLPPGAPSNWNQAYLNLVVEVEVNASPQQFLGFLQEIEKKLGREKSPRWSPRTIDIDIIDWGGLTLSERNLELPHPRASERSFVLDPWAELDRSYLKKARSLPGHMPRWMGVINLTPDSFSDGGVNTQIEELEKRLGKWDSLPIAILDIGGESTRPGARALSADEEWARISATLQFLCKRYQSKMIRPRLSVDTRHSQVARLALEAGADWINDVSGLQDPEMISVLKEFNCPYVLMHSFSIPADPQQTLREGDSATIQLKTWFEQKLALLEESGISRDRIILDPGIGFGKTSLQSIELMKNIRQFHDFHLPLLVGHSRKSFLKDISRVPASERDPESVGIALALCSSGVEIIRAHDPVLHQRAQLGWNSVRAV